MLNTETPQREHAELDLYDTPRLLATLAGDHQAAVAAVQAALPELARAVDAALPRLQAGGRLVYVGAGTSGRLGVLDGAELTPTFTWPAGRTVGLIAGGPGAMFKAVEGAEDDDALGARDIAQAAVNANDVVLLIAASGHTPYVLGALHAARAAGALTIALANNPRSPITQAAEIGITLDTGPEVISGSTRLKAGTAQKIALNSLSSALMVRLHKVYGNLMVDVVPSNAKLRRRAVRLVMQAAGADEAQAAQALDESGWRVKVAVVAIRNGSSAAAAEARLNAVHGSLRAALLPA
jgi:N-acetylmuramic acid 6-phosphate etherase